MTSTKAHVEIIHNPFSENEKTKILLDGREVDQGSKFFGYKDLNLQSWCHVIFDELKETYSEDYHLEFTGLAVDCEDMREAAEVALKKGIKFSYTDNVVKKNATERLSELEQLLDDVQKHPVFAPIIEGNQTFAELIDNSFDIFVVATMSSGKSTFINAMLGCDLLPSANQATTATIAEIIDNKSLPPGKYLVSRTNINGEIINEQQELDLTKKENIKSDLLSTWNSDIDKQQDDNDKTGKIQIEGNLIGIELENNNVKLRLSDTPGPNNSQNANHSKTTLGKIQDTVSNPLIIYILNGTQLETNDDNILLSNIAEMVKAQGKLAQDRFIFIINKMDTYFSGKENIPKAIQDVKEYLERKEIINPRVFPITASIAKLLRIEEIYLDLLDEDDKDTLTSSRNKITRQDDRDLSQYMVLNSRIKSQLESISNEALKRTGLPALEKYISDYIEKYNEPYRIIRIKKAIKLLIDNAETELKNITLLKGKSEEQLQHLNRFLKDAQEKIKSSEHTKKFISEMIDKEIILSENVSNFTTKAQNETFTLFIDKRKNIFTGLESQEKADAIIKKTEDELENEINKFYITLEKLNIEEQEKQLSEINNQFKNLIGNLFNDIIKDIDIDMDIISNIKKSTTQISQRFDKRKYIKIKVEYIRKFNLLNPFTWFASDERRETNEFDLKEYWKDKSLQIEEFIQYTIQGIHKELTENAKKLTEVYCKQLIDNLEKKISEINSTLERESEKKEELEKKIDKAKQELNTISQIEQKLTRVETLEL